MVVDYMSIQTLLGVLHTTFQCWFFFPSVYSDISYIHVF